MAINLLRNFSSNEAKITSRFFEECDIYYQHDCRKSLWNHFQVLQAADQMCNMYENEYDIPVIIPITKSKQLIDMAVYNRAYAANPIVKVEALSHIDDYKVRYIQRLIDYSLKQQRFRDIAFRSIKRFAAVYGTAVAYTVWHNRYGSPNRIVKTPYGTATELAPKIIASYPQVKHIHSLNYIQDPSVANHYDASFAGHIDTISIAELKAAYNRNPDIYIKKNINAIIKQKLKGQTEIASAEFNNFFYDQTEDHQRIAPYSQGTAKLLNDQIHIVKFFSYMRFKGNEDSMTRYYLEVVGDKVIKFIESPYEYDETQYSIFTGYRRDDTWWGNNNASFHLLQEQVLNTLTSMKISNDLKGANSMLFVKDQLVDLNQLKRSRYQNGIVVAKNLPSNEAMQNSFYHYQPQVQNTQSFDASINRILEYDKLLDTNTPSDPQANKYITAQAQGSIQQHSGILEQNSLDEFNIGLSDMAHTMFKSYIVNADNVIQASPDSEIIPKSELIENDISFKVDTAMYSNNDQETLKLNNLLTSYLNMKGTGDPNAQEINIRPLLKKLIETGNPYGINTDEILPDQPQQQQIAPQPQEGALLPPQ